MKTQLTPLYRSGNRLRALIRLLTVTQQLSDGVRLSIQAFLYGGHVSYPGEVLAHCSAQMYERVKEEGSQPGKTSAGSDNLGRPCFTICASHEAFSSESCSFLLAELTWKCLLLPLMSVGDLWSASEGTQRAYEPAQWNFLLSSLTLHMILHIPEPT